MKEPGKNDKNSLIFFRLIKYLVTVIEYSLTSLTIHTESGSLAEAGMRPGTFISPELININSRLGIE